MEKGRFAPSPSGRMHLGNLFSFLLAWLDARSAGGRMLLRMEDLDPDRTGEPYTSQLARDLAWLGLDWDEGWGKGGDQGPYDQRSRTALYDAAFAELERQGLVYPCWCSRHQRLAASAPHPGEERDSACPCYSLGRAEREARALVKAPAWKVHVPARTIGFTDLHMGPQSFRLEERGDFIIRRTDGVYGYQLAVAVDDARMGVTRVVRGRDLLDSTPWQLWLMERLGYVPPAYGHVPLLLAPDGKRLAKRDGATDLGALRTRMSPEEILGELGSYAGLLSAPAPRSARALLDEFAWNRVPMGDIPLPA